jgi:hypothetical protein
MTRHAGARQQDRLEFGSSNVDCPPLWLIAQLSLPLVRHVNPGIVRHSRYRRGTGPPSGRPPPRGVARSRRASQIYRLERVAGPRIIAPQRNNSAHLHRPWRANDFSMLCVDTAEGPRDGVGPARVGEPLTEPGGAACVHVLRQRRLSASGLAPSRSSA